MKKTVLVELIKDIQELKKTLLYPSSFKAIDDCIDLCYSKLELEKEQIIDAFWNGDNTDCLSEQNAKEFAEKYYNETYEKI